jgi:hypothetical protein
MMTRRQNMAFYDMGRMERPDPDSQGRLRNSKCGRIEDEFWWDFPEKGVTFRIKYLVDKDRIEKTWDCIEEEIQKQLRR